MEGKAMKPNQADREMAANLYMEIDHGDPHVYGEIILGDADHKPIVQSLMRHRLAGMELTRAEAARVAGEHYMKSGRHHDVPACREIASAILATDLNSLEQNP
jgi:hypothetical protein